MTNKMKTILKWTALAIAAVALTGLTLTSCKKKEQPKPATPIVSNPPVDTIPAPIIKNYAVCNINGNSWDADSKIYINGLLVYSKCCIAYLSVNVGDTITMNYNCHGGANPYIRITDNQTGDLLLNSAYMNNQFIKYIVKN